MIKQRRVNKIEKYLRDIPIGEKVYIAIKNITLEELNELRNQNLKPIEKEKIYVPEDIGPTTRFNLYGKEVVIKNLEKVPRLINRNYNIKDWHGNWHSGVASYSKYCFPRQIVPPPVIEIIYTNNMVVSKGIENRKDNYSLIRHTINLFLEIFGQCEILDLNYEGSFLNDVKIERVPWRILPEGEYPWEKVKKHYDIYIDPKVKLSDRETIKSRHKLISNYVPDRLIIGEDEFSGYLVYVFTKKNLSVFESYILNNATYIFGSNYETYSKLTKSEIIRGKLCNKRIIHSKNWSNEIKNLF